MQRIWIIFLTVTICLMWQMLYGQQKQFMWDGIMRSYVVYEPPLDPNPSGYPLVIGLHGTGSSGVGFIATAFLAQKALQEKFIAACPDALNHNLFTYFNAGDGFEELTNGTDDVGFISALIDSMITNYNVDESRIYVMGFSNGSSMAYRMAVGLSDKIAAIGAGSGQMVYEYYNPEFPVPIIHIHGLSDELVPYGGKGDSTIVIPPVDSVLAKWRKINNCSPTPETIYENEFGVVGKKWKSSKGNADIILYTVPAMEHQWAYTSTFGISSTDIMWDFFKIHAKGDITHIGKNKSHSMPYIFRLYQNYPNPFNPSTTIEYDLNESNHISLKILNIAGQEIRTLVDEFQLAGKYKTNWQPRNLVSGIYFCKIESGNYSEIIKLVLEK